MEENFGLAKIILPFMPYVIKQISLLVESHRQDSEKVSDAIQEHLTEVINWASKVQFFGMGTPQLTEEATIALDIYSGPRRFQSTTDQKTRKQETDLLLEPHHILLIGEAGSGKTTTLKRITLAVLKEEPVGESDTVQYPIIIRLRELSEGESLLSRIAAVFGLSIETREVIVRETIRDLKGRLIEKETKHTEMHIGKDKVEIAIPRFLNQSEALLILDGLDELRSEQNAKIRDEIVTLGLRLTTSKIIASCRSGDYTRQMNGFAVFELCPLTKEQILSIKDKWLGPDDTEFIKCLQNVPYFDVGDRPLLLTQLLFHYKRYGYLPDQPSHIYAKLVNLLLTAWDAERGIKRESQYAGFNPTKKAEFLAALSYRLTYSLEKTTFTQDDFVKAYISICGRFKLPPGQAVQVAREIQTHTGIVILGPKDFYEFCHLSLQEYLAAEYIVRSPLDIQVTTYLSKYSAPLAIAVALSSNPSNWFASLILTFGNLNDFDDVSMTSFLSRMLIESPSFEASEPAGLAILALFAHYRNNAQVCYYLEQLLETSSFIESIAKALRWYVPKPKHDGQNAISFIEVNLRTELEGVYRFKLPTEGLFPRRILPRLKEFAGKNFFAGRPLDLDSQPD